MKFRGWREGVWVAAGFLLLVAPSGTRPALAQGTAAETVDFSIQIEPVFIVNSTSEQGGNIEFPFKPGTAISRTARVSVRSNTGRPYRLLQSLEQPLLNDRGINLAEEPVLFTVTNGLQGGRSEVNSPQPLTTQPVVIFSSSPQGESDDFTIAYTVSSKQLLPAGSYRARILIKEEFR